MRTPWWWLVVVCLGLSGLADAEEGAAPLTKLYSLSPPGSEVLYSGEGQELDGSFVFQRYAEDGRSKFIYEYDFANHKVSILASGVKQERYRLMARGARFDLVQTDGNPPSFPIQLVERQSRSVVKTLRLRDHPQAAGFDGDRLVLLQFEDAGAGETLKANFFELPSLKQTRSIALDRGKVLAATDKGFFLETENRRQLRWYSPSFELIGTFSLPSTEAFQNGVCEPKLLVSEQFAVLQANCGVLYVYDLKRFALTQTIPRLAQFVSTAAVGDWLFVSGGEAWTAVFDLRTGRELGRIDGVGGNLSIKADRLLISGRWPLDVYKINAGAIADGAWRINAIKASCDTEKELDAGVYAAIEACAKAGMDALLAGAKTPEWLVPYALTYARWLSDSLHRFDEALAIFDRLKAQGVVIPAAAYAEAQSKAQYFGGDPVTSGMPQSGFSDLLQKSPPYKTIALPAKFPGTLTFIDDSVYEQYYDCLRQDIGAGVRVYDRSTFREKVVLGVALCDDEQQDAVKSVFADRRHVYVRTGMRYPESTQRHDFFVFSKENWALVRSARLKNVAPSAKQSTADLRYCECDGRNNCSALDVQRSVRYPLSDASCVDGRIDRGRFAPPYSVAVSTPRFYVRADGEKYSFNPRETPDVVSYVAKVGERGYQNSVFKTPDGDSVVVVGDHDELVRPAFWHIDPIRKTQRNVLRLKDLGRASVGRYCVHFSTGFELFSLNLQSLKLVSVLPIANRKSANAMNEKIGGVDIDGDRLIIRTRSEGRVYSLDALGCGRDGARQ